MNKRILSKLNEMEKYLSELESILPEKKKDYLQDLTVKRACEKTVQLAIEALIDCVSMLVAEKKLGTPNSEDGLIDLLLKNKLVSKKLGQKVKKMKGFRNLLVHKYGELEDEQVYHFLTNELKDFDLFRYEVSKL